VALEAMASGLPVVSSDAGGVLENLRPGLNGMTVRAGDPAAFADAAIQLVDDVPQRLALAQGARAFAVARDWAAELDALVPLYSGVSGARQGAPAEPVTAVLADR
jgi:glycosyltransferase involved in cell wall biosynthesis